MTPARPHILSLSCVFPNPSEPGCGLFIRNRLLHLARRTSLVVAAPIAPFDYDNPKGKGLGRRSVPHSRQDDQMEVLHPAWVYFPGNRAVNGLLLGLQLAGALRRLRRRFAFDVIDAHFAHPDGVAACVLAKLFDCPFLITLRGNELAHEQSPSRRRMMSWAIRRAAGVVTLSDELRDLAVRLGAGPDRVKVIPNGIDGRLFFRRDREAMRNKHGLRQDRPVILSAGRLIELKGFQHALRAFAGLKERGAQLLIAGEASRGLPSYEGPLRRLSVELGLEDSVQFLSWVPQETLAELMTAADVFCLASRREGSPNAVSEALACGTPVVVTNVGTVSKLVPSEEFGYVVPVDDPVSLTVALQRALGRSWDHAAIAAWGGARSWDNVADEVLEVVRRVIAETKGEDLRAFEAVGQ